MYFDRSNYDNNYYLAYYIFNGIVIRDKTIRDLAQELHMAKSTIHCFIHKHCPVELGFARYATLCDVLKNNFNTKYIHGGEATRNKYRRLKEQKNGYTK